MQERSSLQGNLLNIYTLFQVVKFLLYYKIGVLKFFINKNMLAIIKNKQALNLIFLIIFYEDL